MPSQTQNLNLTLYDRENDIGSFFLDFRDDLAGTDESNMKKIDKFAGETIDKLNELEFTSKMQDEEGAVYRFGKDDIGVYLVLEDSF